MVSDDHNCIFVHINKTAGTSIARALGHPLNLKQNHNTVTDYIEAMGGDYYQYFTFSFVRNPWDKMVSLFFMERAIQTQYYNENTTFDEYLRTLKNIHTARGLHAKFRTNQLAWLKDETGRIAVDFIGRFENIADDWEYVCKKIGANIMLGHQVKSEGRPVDYRTIYTDYSREWVEKAFADDIIYFDYKF